MNEDELELQGENDEDQELFEHYRVVADKGQSPLRIDKFLMNRIENGTSISMFRVLSTTLTMRPSLKIRATVTPTLLRPGMLKQGKNWPKTIWSSSQKKICKEEVSQSNKVVKYNQAFSLR